MPMQLDREHARANEVVCELRNHVLYRLPYMDRREVGTGALLLVTAAITGWATAIAMIGPLLVDLSRDLDVPLAQAGLLGAALSLPWALGAPLSGLLSDRLGRRPLMVLALCGVGGATISSAFATSFPILL